MKRVTFHQPLTTNTMSGLGKPDLSQAIQQPINLHSRKRSRSQSGNQNIQPPNHGPLTFMHAPHMSQSPEYEQYRPSPMPMHTSMTPQMIPLPTPMHFPHPHPTDMANFGKGGHEAGGSTIAAFQAAGARSRSVSQASPELQMSPTLDFDGYGEMVSEMPGSKRQKQLDDHEDALRTLSDEVRHKSLLELAQLVRVSDATSRAERERQGFGMGW
ncbi:hypothetical protein ABW21_db0203606 [Orbilia brochopaga]|nr:hypothetical protein ABW21_db0203606 [Drechslerella brochopaga]